MHLQLRDGSERDVTMIADAPEADAPNVYSDSYVPPRRIDGESEAWTPLLPRDAGLPQLLRDYDTPFRTAWWPNQHTYCVQFRSNMDVPGHSIGYSLSASRGNLLRTIHASSTSTCAWIKAAI